MRLPPHASQWLSAALLVAVPPLASVLCAQPVSATAPQPPPTSRPPAVASAVVSPADVLLLAQLGKRPNRVHDPSTIVRGHGDYWLFYTGRGVRSLHSRDLVT
jgi:hypothetical protein